MEGLTNIFQQMLSGITFLHSFRISSARSFQYSDPYPTSYYNICSQLDIYKDRWIIHIQFVVHLP